MLPIFVFGGAVAAFFLSGCRDSSERQEPITPSPEAQPLLRKIPANPSSQPSSSVKDSEADPDKEGPLKAPLLSPCSGKWKLVPKKGLDLSDPTSKIGFFGPTGGKVDLYRNGNGYRQSILITPSPTKSPTGGIFDIFEQRCRSKLDCDHPRLLSRVTMPTSRIWEGLYIVDHDKDGIQDLILTMSDGVAWVIPGEKCPTSKGKPWF